MKLRLSLPKFFKNKWVLVSLLIISIGAIGLIVFAYLNRATAPLIDINSVEELKTIFNQDKGNTRVILLMSPT